MINFMRDQGVSKIMPVVDPDVEYEVKDYLVLVCVIHLRKTI